VKLTSGLAHIASQSTALIPADVQERIADSHRLDLSLLYGEKPVVTGAFTIDGFEVMRDLQLAVRGSAEALRQKPLCVFSCCPTAPLKWSAATSQNLVDCARWSIPVEFVSMPLSGFVAPVTLAGSLIQKTAETLSGVVISQLANPGHPVLYGGSPAIFDIRYETTPMGAMLAALSGINRISGPGMLDFESCQSLEKLVVDNEICGMTYRLLEGIQPREDFPALPILQELLREKHLLIADQTRRYLRREISYRGPTIDRGCPTAARPN
jgi:trimethylamine--corrinoid protein Co-methyltransferase